MLGWMRNTRSRLGLLWLLGACSLLAMAMPRDSGSQEPAPSGKSVKSPVIPRGKRLVLKDGTFQVVREYRLDGERIRYFSLERGDWEELPAAMVDWEATAKAASDADAEAKSMAEKAHQMEAAKRMEAPLDINASLPVGQGAFLPESEGMFVVEGKSVRVLDLVGSQLKRSMGRTIAEVLTPVRVVPGKKYVQIPGSHATLRLRSKNPEFYLREAPPDPEHPTTMLRSSAAGDNGPDVELIRAKVTRNSRILESITSLFREPISDVRKTVSIQRWEIAPTVYRFTISEALPPGEYALAEILPGGLNYFVWDFGVDGEADKGGK